MQLDDFTKKHLQQWLNNTIPFDEHEETIDQIMDVLENNPDLLNTHSWGQILRLYGYLT
jgi:hypothetical protein